MHPLDKASLLRVHTTVLDGKVVTLRACDWYIVPSHLNFTTMHFWVRISGLPFGYLDPQWAQNILAYVGFVEIVQGLPYVVPTNLE
ncbi:Glycine cleavage system H protein [Bienertia sinuspersici]